MTILQAIWDLIQRFLLHRALNTEIADDVCVACDSGDLKSLGERVYRCNACGYEGGSGYAHYKQSQQQSGYDQMLPADRHQLAVDKLDEARTLTMSGIGDLEGALEASASDVRSEYHQHDLDKHDVLMAAFRLLTEAEALLDDAAYLLGESFAGRPDVTDVMEVAVSSMNNMVDFRLLDGGLHRKIQNARSEANELLRWCDYTLAKVRENPPASNPAEQVW